MTCCCGNSTPCCPYSLPTTLYLHWTGQTGCNYSMPNPIPLNYFSVSQVWASVCYYDATANCYTFFSFSCIPPTDTCPFTPPFTNGCWELQSGAVPTSAIPSNASTCSPFDIVFGSITGASWLLPNCGGSAGSLQCNGGTTIDGVSVTT